VGEAFDIVRSGYDRIGVRYREWSSVSPTRLNFVRRLLRELTPGSLVVELGCGPGEPATRLLAAEHRVLAVDASLAQLQLAREAAPTAALVQADMARLHLRAGSADAVASFYTLGHLPSHEHAPLLHAIAHWLRPAGVLLTSAPLRAGDDRDESWLGVPMYFGGIGETATRQAIESAGLVVEEWQVVPEDEGEGKMVRFLWVLARKPQFG
jgi:SAM-dependent methyltransferase